MSDLAAVASADYILLIDDQAQDLRLLSSLLAERGHHVRPVTDGKMGLIAATAHAPDLILLDIVMPGTDGYEICKRLKADKRTCDIPIIFISSLDQVQDIVKGFQCGGVDYITKPFRREEVCARVDAHVRLRRLTQHLDELVQQRTQELDAAHQELAKLERAKQALINAEAVGLRSALAVVKEFLGDAARPLPPDYERAMSEVIETVETMLKETSLDPQSMQKGLSGWLIEKLAENKWSMHDLARQTERFETKSFSVSTISRVVSGEQRPSLEFCTAMARVFQVSLGQVLQLADVERKE